MGKPKIRFEGYSEDWEQRKLGDLIEDNIIIEQSDGNHGELYPRSDEFTDAGIPYIAASAISSSGDDIDFNLVKYLPLKRAEQFRKGVAQNGDILLAHNATVGPCLQLSMEYDFAILSTSLTLFRINENKMNSKFFLQMLRSDLFQNQLFKYMKQTTRSQVPILTQRKLEVCYPNNTQDQELIGTYLSNLDHLITLHQRKYDETKTLKKYMLQKMFPQNGEKVPEIRFDGFTEDWEQCKSGEIAPLRGGFAFKSNEYCSEGIPIVRISNILSDGSVGEDYAYYCEQASDEIYTLYDGAVVLAMSGATTGKVSVLRAEKGQKYYQNQRVGYFIPTDICDYSFVKTIMRSHLFTDQLSAVLVAGAQPNVSSKEIDGFEFLIPQSKEEQKKIGAYFTNLDHLIALHQRKCNELKEIKKYMLQNMFV